ncbi:MULTISPECIES: 6-phosphogluconolactonase [unclassified Haematobacter]|uniref:6-phosphogluconolactonase n=1 Tax=unclassified Haematobacter TaxID=2640585 RepID=UPI0025BECF05|nr:MULTISPECIES: 6-phosphogluconolactonase [unclassified Haematobacter]
MDFIDYPDRAQWAAGAAEAIAADLEAALETQDRVTLAVPGGTTPGPVFDLLSAVPLDWARVTVLPTDERQVPEDSDRSNARLIRERLLTGPASSAGFQPLWGEDAETVREAVSALLPIDVLLLGMGADLHVASLFPGAEGLKAAFALDAPPVVEIRAAAAGEPRVSLSAEVLADARQVHLLIAGQDKRKALQGLPQGGSAGAGALKAPVALVLDRARIHWSE